MSLVGFEIPRIFKRQRSEPPKYPFKKSKHQSRESSFEFLGKTGSETPTIYLFDDSEDHSNSSSTRLYALYRAEKTSSHFREYIDSDLSRGPYPYCPSPYPAPELPFISISCSTSPRGRFSSDRMRINLELCSSSRQGASGYTSAEPSPSYSTWSLTVEGLISLWCEKLLTRSRSSYSTTFLAPASYGEDAISSLGRENIKADSESTIVSSAVDSESLTSSGGSDSPTSRSSDSNSSSSVPGNNPINTENTSLSSNITGSNTGRSSNLNSEKDVAGNREPIQSRKQRKTSPNSSLDKAHSLRCIFNAIFPSDFCVNHETLDTFRACGGPGWNTFQHLKEHTKTLHRKKPDTLRCSDCQEDFRNPEQLSKHRKTVDCEKRCQYCDKTFSTRNQRNTHQNVDHPSGLQPSTTKELDDDTWNTLQKDLKVFVESQRKGKCPEDPDLRKWVEKNTPRYSIGRPNGGNPILELGQWYVAFMSIAKSLVNAHEKLLIPAHPFHDYFSAAELAMEKISLIFDNVVGARIQDNCGPPSQMPNQLDWYKDALKASLRIAAKIKVVLPKQDSFVKNYGVESSGRTSYSDQPDLQQAAYHQQIPTSNLDVSQTVSPEPQPMILFERDSVSPIGQLFPNSNQQFPTKIAISSHLENDTNRPRTPGAKSPYLENDTNYPRTPGAKSPHVENDTNRPQTPLAETPQHILELQCKSCQMNEIRSQQSQGERGLNANISHVINEIRSQHSQADNLNARPHQVNESGSQQTHGPNGRNGNTPQYAQSNSRSTNMMQPSQALIRTGNEPFESQHRKRPFELAFGIDAGL